MREIRAILREDHGIARVIELNRPDRRNALSAQLLSELNEALEEADKDDSVRAVVIRGSEVVFSAGADLREALEATTVGATLRFLAALRRVNTTIGLLSKPVIALIRGYCLTGGLELAMACDVRVAEIGSQFGITSSRIGSIAGAGGTQRLARLVGPSVAKELLFSARMFDAEEALRLGLVNKVCRPGDGLSAALAYVATWAKNAPLAIWLAKMSVNTGLEMSLESALDFETLLTTALFTTSDRYEGMKAVLEKRQPIFRGE